eukprot:202857-Chlamydomonas_euryale.AAC.1
MRGMGRKGSCEHGSIFLGGGRALGSPAGVSGGIALWREACAGAPTARAARGSWPPRARLLKKRGFAKALRAFFKPSLPYSLAPMLPLPRSTAPSSLPHFRPPSPHPPFFPFPTSHLACTVLARLRAKREFLSPSQKSGARPSASAASPATATSPPSLGRGRMPSRSLRRLPCNPATPPLPQERAACPAAAAAASPATTSSPPPSRSLRVECFRATH